LQLKIYRIKSYSFLRLWLLEHESICDKWPANAIHHKIKEILKDWVINEEERTAFLSLLQEITGNYFSETGSASPEKPALPLDMEPNITFENKSFCFTGVFLYGTRATCESVIDKLSGYSRDGVQNNLDYLVNGHRINPDWLHETYGLKFKKQLI
jgi:NAD-dependent DNA ligase